jgi:hypothetical protein
MAAEAAKGGKTADQDVLYRRMTIVMHGIIFLYAAAFWIQTGVLPVSPALLASDALVIAFVCHCFLSSYPRNLVWTL